MPFRKIAVKGKAPSRGSEVDRVFDDFDDLSLADKHVPGRSYGRGDYYSSSEPRYETRSPGRTYARDEPRLKPYHGPHFERALAQEELWNARGSRDVWDPDQPERSVAARPETYGRAHSTHRSRVEHQYTDPYEKRPAPYTARTEADYDAYKRPSEGHRGISDEVGRCKATPVGRKHHPHESARDSLLRGRERATDGRRMANLAAQSRSGFDLKYPQGYESHDKVRTHYDQAMNQHRSAGIYADDIEFLDGRLAAWEKQRVDRGLR